MSSLIDKEREFHNKRFAHGDDRDAQLKYYWAIAPQGDSFWELIQDASRGAKVLEYGCSTGGRSAQLGLIANRVEGIDISDVAIEHARKQCSAPNVAFHVMDAMNMTFADETFDLVFGSGIIHHLDTARSMDEIWRVLKPGGQALFWEPLGLNPAINFYRRVTPGARTPDEHPLLPRDYQLMRNRFGKMDAEYFGLSTLAAVPFRHMSFAPIVRQILSRIDSAILKIPTVNMLAWYSIIRLTK